MLFRRVVHSWFGRYDGRKEPYGISEPEDHKMDVDMELSDSPAVADEPIICDVAPEAPVSEASYSSFFSERFPAEVIEQILLEAWLDIPLQSPLDRWAFFANLSLVSRKYRSLALWIATRHVRVLCHSSMDIDAYHNIGQRQLSWDGDALAGQDRGTSLAALFQRSTVYLDITYAKRWMYLGRDRWLRDDVSPGRPDDALPPVFDGLHLLHDPEGPEREEPIPEWRVQGYLEWLRRRRRDRLSGWFAELLDVVPDCVAVEISAADEDVIDALNVKTYGTLLESLWWWPSLSSLCLSVLPRRFSFKTWASGSAQGPQPVLPSLPSVKAVRLSKYPRCSCDQSSLAKDDGGGHPSSCIMQRVLQPYPHLRTLYLDTAPDKSDDVVLHPNCQPQIFQGPPREPTPEGTGWDEDEVTELIYGGGGGEDETTPPLLVPGLKLARSDTLWETIKTDYNRKQPEASWFPAPGEGEDFLFYA
ncbi:hypothetical protein GY45DRAFT_1116936 [Cubamyces sp. BRFM 1775]|nr:hypothetical protein GY45DRAFT_1116936 [Cubamyces sp. BRFM 1775]